MNNKNLNLITLFTMIVILWLIIQFWYIGVILLFIYLLLHFFFGESKAAKNAKFMIPQYYRHVVDSKKLVDNTANVKTFIERYKFLMQRLYEIKHELTFLNNKIHMEVIFYDHKEIVDLTGDDINELISTYGDIYSIQSNFFDNCYTKLLDKINSLKTNRGKINNIVRLENQLADFKDELEYESYHNFINRLENLRNNLNSK